MNDFDTVRDLIEETVRGLLAQHEVSGFVDQLLRTGSPATESGVVAATVVEEMLVTALAPVARGMQHSLNGTGGSEAWALELGHPLLSYGLVDPVELGSYAADRLTRALPRACAAFPHQQLPEFCGPDGDELDEAVCAACLLDDCTPDECLKWHATVAYAEAMHRAGLDAGWEWAHQYGSPDPVPLATRMTEVSRTTPLTAHRSTPEQLLWGALFALAGHRYLQAEHAVAQAAVGLDA